MKRFCRSASNKALLAEICESRITRVSAQCDMLHQEKGTFGLRAQVQPEKMQLLINELLFKMVGFQLENIL